LSEEKTSRSVSQRGKIHQNLEFKRPYLIMQMNFLSDYFLKCSTSIP
jgi:hypothetical protein